MPSTHTLTQEDVGRRYAMIAININSQFAVCNEDGSETIHFGGDENTDNYMHIFEGWNCALRIYEPAEGYLNGEWVMPELEIIE